MTLRTRLAPSPTGALHLGNARSFLLAWLWARSTGAEVVLRVEDLDGPRTKAGAAEQAVEDLRWLGLDWDGEVLYQSQRDGAYAAALAQLQEAGLVYPCACTRKEIEAARSAPNEGELRPRYPGTCRERAGAPSPDSAWRLKVPPGRETSYQDSFRGLECEVPAETEGDFVVAKKTGEAAYQLAVVVDDAYQEISHVIRGDDLVPSTHLQLLLYEALGLAAPAFVHLPLVRGPDGRRLAKRHGDTRIASYREAGVPPERVLGLLGSWSGLCERTPISASELSAAFSWERVPRADVTCDEAAERWLRGE